MLPMIFWIWNSLPEMFAWCSILCVRAGGLGVSVSMCHPNAMMLIVVSWIGAFRLVPSTWIKFGPGLFRALRPGRLRLEHRLVLLCGRVIMVFQIAACGVAETGALGITLRGLVVIAQMWLRCRPVRRVF